MPNTAQLLRVLCTIVIVMYYRSLGKQHVLCYSCITFSCDHREREILSVGLSVVNSVRRGYPPEEGAHIAIRKMLCLEMFIYSLCCYGNSGTVRRFLEHYSDQVELIVFVVQTDYVS